MTTTVTTTEFRRNIDVYSKTARSEPVVITGEDRDELVLIAAEDYERLKRRDDRVACHPSELPEEMKQALRESIREMDEQGVEASDYPVLKF